MSQENPGGGIADVLEELADMKRDDPEGYEAVVEDLRNEQADPDHQRGQALLDAIAARPQHPLAKMLNDAHLASLEGEQE